ncbi:lmo0937 family membrane protein [Mucilaginibacter gotjawali]|uniref:Membrane protein n=1 Tax=Mucilaginibacter gotjawali TaxID=1550579 RepID=A0A839SBB8_9SPHI|nr:lmo0937 family membrane protein [Mucilaginibacter gotjawali]MBB3054868.1 putative membrane protein [Mucilaginibacter gotjawali]
MRSILYIIAVILIIGWAIGTFAYAAGGLIHILLVIAVIAIILGLIRRDSTVI